ncbi:MULTISPECIES: ribbon-helix-helix protein, CopG family [unclassified Nocardioides]
MTDEQLAAVERECSLTGKSVSDVVRAALAVYLTTPAKKRRKS